MARRINHSRLRFVGRETESGKDKVFKLSRPHTPAPGGKVRILSAEERAAWAAEHGFRAA